LKIRKLRIFKCFNYEVKHTPAYTGSGGSFTAARLKRIILILFKCADYNPAF